MAAAPGEVPPPAKRMKQDTSCLETITAAGGWSSLPDDLVRRIAETFLPTNDLDHYMCFRAVCPNWRRATDDPKNDADHRFHPLLWIVLDEVFQSDDDRRILLNTATGRFLHKKLPLLLDYHVVATHGAFFVLADRIPPHAAAVFNPLTGHLVSFAAPMPPEVTVAFVCFSRKTSSLALFLLGDSSCKRYTAVSESESFVSRELTQVAYNCIRKELVAGANPHLSSGPGFDGSFARLGDLVRFLHGDFAKVFSPDLPGDANDDCIRCFPVGLETHMPLVLKFDTILFVFKMNTKIGKLVRMESINNFAIFIGHRRCLPVDAYDFPGIEANCVYYTEHLGSSAHIYKYNIKDKQEERISEAPEFVKRDTKFVLVADRPFTIIQLLCSYTINIPDSQLALQHMS